MRLELLTAPEDAFVLGRDLLGFATLGDDPDVWTDVAGVAGEIRASRGGPSGRPNKHPAGVLSVALRDTDPDTDSRFRVGRRVRLYDPDRDAVLWYGRVTGVPTEEVYDKDTGEDYATVTLTAGDVVAELANTTRFGAGAYGVPETLRSRVARLSTTATVPLVYVQEENHLGDLRATWSATATATAEGLRPGHLYRHTFTWTSSGPTRVGDLVGMVLIEQEGQGRYHYLEVTSGQFVLEFTATVAGSATFTVYAESHAVVTAHDVTVTRVEGPAALQAVAYEGPLTEHLGMASDSVGATWRPTLDGRAEVIEGQWTRPVVAVFSDTAEGVPCTEIAMGSDYFVNDLTVTNRGRDIEGKAVDTSTHLVNVTSVAGYGRSAEAMATCLASPQDVADVSADRLDDYATPARCPVSVTYQYDDLATVPDLDDRVRVLRRGTYWPCDVVGVQHRVIPDPDEPTGKARRHLVTLNLRKGSE